MRLRFKVYLWSRFISSLKLKITATYWSYVKRAALYRTFISQSFVRGNNSNDAVAGRVSGWSLTRVDTQCVYHPLQEMWS